MPFPLGAITAAVNSGTIPEPGPPPDMVETPLASFHIESTHGQAPFTLDITNNSEGSIDSYRWNFGDGLIVDTISAVPPSHTYTGAGSFTVTLTVSNAGGSDSQSQAVTVSAAPAAPVPSFTSSPTSGPSPLAVAFTNTTTGAATSYLWQFGDGSVSMDANPSHTFRTAGAFIVTLTATGPGGSATTQATITATAPASSGTRVYFKLHNPSTAPIAGGVISRAMVPFSKTEGPYSTSTFSIENAAGQKVPCQFVVLSRWHGFPSDTSKRIKAVQCIFSADVAAGGSADYALNIADTPAGGALTYSETAAEFTINTGAATFKVPKNSAGLFNRVSIGSEEIVDRGSALDIALSDGQKSEAEVSAVVEVSGSAMLRIRRTGRIGPAGGLRFTLRQSFYSGSTGCEVEFSLENSKVPWQSSPVAVDGMLRIAHAYLDVTIKHSGTLTVRDAVGDVAVGVNTDYKYLAWARRLNHEKTDLTTKIYDGGLNHSFTTRHTLRTERQGITTEGATYSGGWSVKGSAGGVVVGVDRFWQMGPRSVEADSSIGRVRIGPFPKGSHERPHAVRPRNQTPFLSSVNVNYRPAGYAQKQAAPVDFPDVTPPLGEPMPPSPGSGSSPLGYWTWNAAAAEWRLNAQPDKRVDPLDVANYRIEGGSWHTIRVGLQFFGSASTPTTAEIANWQSFADRPPLGLCAPARYRETDLFLGQYCEKLPQQQDPDADRAWRYFEILADNLAADPVPAESGNGFPTTANQYRGWPLLIESGGIINYGGAQNPYGYNSFGDTFYGAEGWGSCHYDTGRAFALGMLANSDTRFLDSFLDHARFQRDMVRFHVGTLNFDTSAISVPGNWKWSGCNRYEQGQWHGSAPDYPGSSHCWIASEVLLYWLLGDARAADSLRYAARYFTFPSHNASPAYFQGTGGERTLSWAIEGLVWIDAALGPLAVGVLPNSLGGVASSSASLLAVAEAGLTNYRRWMTGQHHFSGASLPAYNRTNYVPAAHHKDITSTDFSSQGFLIAPAANPKYNTQPWMSALFLQAGAMFLRAHPEKDFTQTRWLEHAQLLYLMATWIVERTMKTEEGLAMNVQHHWYPERVLSVRGKQGTASGVFINAPSGSNAFASYTVNGNHSAGATSVALTAPAGGGGTVLAGEVVEFEGHKIASDAVKLWPYRVSTTLSGLTLSLSNPLITALPNGTRMQLVGRTESSPNQVPTTSNEDRAGSAGSQSLTGKFNTNLLLLWNGAMGLAQYTTAVQGSPYGELATGTVLPVVEYAWRQCVRYSLHLGDWELAMPSDPGAFPGPWVQSGPTWAAGPGADLPPINIDRGVLFGGIAAKFLPREKCSDSMATWAVLSENGLLS